MANIKSAIKRIRITERQHERNKAVRSGIKTSIAKFRAAVDKKDKKAAKEAYDSSVKALDSAVSKKVIHRNNAANRKSALSKALGSIKKK